MMPMDMLIDGKEWIVYSIGVWSVEYVVGMAMFDCGFE